MLRHNFLLRLIQTQSIIFKSLISPLQQQQNACNYPVYKYKFVSALSETAPPPRLACCHRQMLNRLWLENPRESWRFL